MSKRPNLDEMSQADLEEYMDGLVRRGEDECDTPEWRRAYKFWEARP